MDDAAGNLLGGALAMMLNADIETAALVARVRDDEDRVRMQTMISPVWMRGARGETARNTPLGRFTRADGDNAIGHRILSFMMDGGAIAAGISARRQQRTELEFFITASRNVLAAPATSARYRSVASTTRSSSALDRRWNVQRLARLEGRLAGFDETMSAEFATLYAFRQRMRDIAETGSSAPDDVPLRRRDRYEEDEEDSAAA